MTVKIKQHCLVFKSNDIWLTINLSLIFKVFSELLLYVWIAVCTYVVHFHPIFPIRWIRSCMDSNLFIIILFMELGNLVYLFFPGGRPSFNILDVLPSLLVPTLYSTNINTVYSMIYCVDLARVKFLLAQHLPNHPLFHDILPILYPLFQLSWQ